MQVGEFRVYRVFHLYIYQRNMIILREKVGNFGFRIKMQPFVAFETGPGSVAQAGPGLEVLLLPLHPKGSDHLHTMLGKNGTFLYF